MKPVDFRNETWASIRERVEEGLRADVLRAWQIHGPGTTEDVCGRWSSDPRAILSFRPRTTELYQLGFIMLVETAAQPGGGTYRARSTQEHRDWLAQQQREASQPQRELSLG